ncbi:hypothetical protein HYH03_008245 [Edaphochlamys debaryana]|uniref:Uncharacterized protein n=1 Tax=Edaphochlamys debaryana TaxID=47281 RepID=A0A835Y0E7_9CHLO|nr:hypothetical protein HYH03_008245 [Edaphochlamys debaryana]|eukprot:KAG2493425.1 hypothetical protein HYH03_008245 [Edaphochlamys debaryana]
MVLVSMTPAEAEKSNGPKPAQTTAEAKAQKAPYLCLSSLKLTELPKGISDLSSLTNLDLSNNALAALPEACLPRSLVELTLTGNQLTELPGCIAGLPRLKKLYAGANRLRNVDAAFCSASLQHAGLAYNAVTCLPPDEQLARCQLLSLDLAHNNLEGLQSTLDTLSLLPSLAALCLSGNPLALTPRYGGEVAQRLRRLMFLDGQRTDLSSASRPGSSSSAAASQRHHHHHHGPHGANAPGGSPGRGPGSPSRSGPSGLGGPGAASAAGPRTASPSRAPSQSHGALGPGGARAPGLGPGLGLNLPEGFRSGTSFGGNTARSFGGVHWGDGDEDEGGPSALLLELSGLAPAEDPFAWLRERWREQVDTGLELGMSVPPQLEVPVPPLQPVVLHVELSDIEGTPLASIPVRLDPPSPPDVGALFDPKLKAAAAAAAAKEAKDAGRKKPGSPAGGKPSSGRGKRGGKSTPEPDAPRELERGLLRATLPLRPVGEHRDWLRAGTMVTLYRTTSTATPRPVVAAEAPPTPSKGARKKKDDAPPPVEYDISSTTEVAGTALLKAGAQVVDGYTLEGYQRLDFTPPPALFDDKSVRMPLKDPRHPTAPVAHMDVRLLLHVPPAAMTAGLGQPWPRLGG